MDDETDKSIQCSRGKKKKQPSACWEKCEQLVRMLLLFVPVLNILDKEGCSLYLFV